MPCVESMILSGQLSWSGHVGRVEDFRLPKSLLYGELTDGARFVRGQTLQYCRFSFWWRHVKTKNMDTLKRSLKRANVLVDDWEVLASDRKKRRKAVHQSTEVIEFKQQEKYPNRRKTLHGILQSTTVCNRCGRNFLSNAGLASHTRASKCWFPSQCLPTSSSSAMDSLCTHVYMMWRMM